MYNCVIDSKFKKGFLVNGYGTLKGKSKKTILITTYLCHPSLANNELSGPLVMSGLYNEIKKWKKRNFTYIFLINPETIGSLCFLHSHAKKINKNISSGLVLTCLGGPKKKLSYKLTKNENSSLDKFFIRLSKKKKILIRKYDAATGSDERQYNSPGFDLPVGNICRSVYGKYKSYHTSGDNKKFMNISKVKKSIDEIAKILKSHDKLLPLQRVSPYGELMLSKRNLYPSIGNVENYKLFKDEEMLNILLNILSYANGKNNIQDIAEVKSFNFSKTLEVLDTCLKLKLVKYA